MQFGWLMDEASMRIAVVANTTWYLFNFRVALINALAEQGHQVVAIGSNDDFVKNLEASNIRHRVFPIRGAGVNPFREIWTVLVLRHILRKERIDVVFSYTPKANIYTLMSASGGLHAFPNVSGLGRAFINRSFLTLVVKILYKFSFKRAERIFFQNQDDLNLFVELGLADRFRVERIPGSGVDLSRFVEGSSGYIETEDRKGFVFLLVARLLWDKGVGEFVEAARKVKLKFPEVEFQLLGFLDVQNPSAVPRKVVEAWEKEGVVRYLGATDEVLPYLQGAQCVVLPSYREGCPRVLLEAAACARPVITTDVPGCRDVVENEVTGYLCKLKDPADLAEKMVRMLRLDMETRQEMGRKGREKMIREFDEQIVIDRYIQILAEC